MSPALLCQCVAIVVPLALAFGFCRIVPDFGRGTAALALLAGAAVAVALWAAAPWLRQLLPLSPHRSPFLAAFLLAALPEETAKLAALAALARFGPSGHADTLLGIAAGIACGFAAAENLIIAWPAVAALSALTERLLFALPALIAFAAISAELVSRGGARMALRPLFLALVVAVAIHTCYDGLTLAGQYWLGWLLLAAAAAVAAAAWHRRLSGRSTAPA